MKLILISMLMLITLFVAASPVSAELCYMCGSGSSCQQCRAGGDDTQAARNACKTRGCNITGTTSCSSAANVKVCERPAPGLDWWNTLSMK